MEKLDKTAQEQKGVNREALWCHLAKDKSLRSVWSPSDHTTELTEAGPVTNKPKIIFSVFMREKRML